MSDAIEIYIEQLPGNLSLLACYLLLLLIAKWVYSLTTSYALDQELTEKDNQALAISVAGYLIAVSIIFVCVLIGPSQGLWIDLLNVSLYSLLGIALLVLSRLINDKLILFKFNNKKELIDDQNAGTGAVQAGSYIASGLLVGGAVQGEGGGLHTALAFFFLGQVALILFTQLYNWITPFDVHEQIEQDNVAAGVAFGGTLIAVGIILLNGIFGNFISWQDNLLRFLANSLLAFFLLPLFRLVLDKLLIRKADLNAEIALDKNLGAGILEMIATVSFAVVLYKLI